MNDSKQTNWHTFLYIVFILKKKLNRRSRSLAITNPNANIWICDSQTHFHWLIYKLKTSRQEVTRTCLKRGCIRSFQERQKQTESEMKGLNIIRLINQLNALVGGLFGLPNQFQFKQKQIKTSSSFKLVQNQFEKQLNNFQKWFKTKPSFRETNSPIF